MKKETDHVDWQELALHPISSDGQIWLMVPLTVTCNEVGKALIEELHRLLQITVKQEGKIQAFQFVDKLCDEMKDTIWAEYTRLEQEKGKEERDYDLKDL